MFIQLTHIRGQKKYFAVASLAAVLGLLSGVYIDLIVKKEPEVPLKIGTKQHWEGKKEEK